MSIYLENYAGKQVDQELVDELFTAGINIERLPDNTNFPNSEVKTSVFGTLHGWRFERAWSYWVAFGPKIPFESAESLNERYKNTVRVDGYAGGQPLKNIHKYGVDSYHVDTIDGLKALADTIKSVVEKKELTTREYPLWTVCYNIVSEEVKSIHKNLSETKTSWVGTGWEFFDDENDATDCYNRQIKNGNCPVKRPFYRTDIDHLGVAHQYSLQKKRQEASSKFKNVNRIRMLLLSYSAELTYNKKPKQGDAIYAVRESLEYLETLPIDTILLAKKLIGKYMLELEEKSLHYDDALLLESVFSALWTIELNDRATKMYKEKE